VAGALSHAGSLGARPMSRPGGGRGGFHGVDFGVARDRRRDIVQTLFNPPSPLANEGELLITGKNIYCSCCALVPALMGSEIPLSETIEHIAAAAV